MPEEAASPHALRFLENRYGGVSERQTREGVPDYYVVDNQTGEWTKRRLDQQTVQGIAAGQLSLPKTEMFPVVSPDTGEIEMVPGDAATRRLQSGWQLPSQEADISRHYAATREQKYGDSPLLAGILGGARGLSLGTSDALIRALGGDEAGEVLSGVREQHPGVSLGTELAGAVIPAIATGGSGALGAAARVTPAGLATRAGLVTEEALLAGTAGSRAAKVAASAGGEAVAGGLFGGGVGLTEAALSEDPITVENLLGEVGMGAILGAGVGAATGAATAGLREGLLARRARREAALESAEKTQSEMIQARQAEVEAEIEILKKPERLQAEKQGLRAEVGREKATLAEKKAELKALKDAEKAWRKTEKARLKRQQEEAARAVRSGYFELGEVAKAPRESFQEAVERVVDDVAPNYAPVQDHLEKLTSSAQFMRSRMKLTYDRLAEEMGEDFEVFLDMTRPSFRADKARLDEALDAFESSFTKRGQQARGKRILTDEEGFLQRVYTADELEQMARSGDDFVAMKNAAEEVRQAAKEAEKHFEWRDVIDVDPKARRRGVLAPEQMEVPPDIKVANILRRELDDALQPEMVGVKRVVKDGTRINRPPVPDEMPVTMRELAEKLQAEIDKLPVSPSPQAAAIEGVLGDIELTTGNLKQMHAREMDLVEAIANAKSDKQIFEANRKMVREFEQMGGQIDREKLALAAASYMGVEALPVEDLPGIGTELDYALKAFAIMKGFGSIGGLPEKMMGRVARSKAPKGAADQLFNLSTEAAGQAGYYQIFGKMKGRAGGLRSFAAGIAARLGSKGIKGALRAGMEEGTVQAAQIAENNIVRQQRAIARIDKYLKAGSKVKRGATPTALQILNALDLGEGKKKARSLQEAYKQRSEEIARAMADSRRIGEKLGPVRDVDLKLGDDAETHARIKLEYAHKVMPKPSRPIGLGSKGGYGVSDSQIAEWSRVMRVVDDPLKLVDALIDGSVSYTQFRAVEQTAPETYRMIRTTIIESTAEGRIELDYQQQVDLSQMVQAPIHISMEPARIMASQTRFAPEEEPKLPAKRLASIKAPEPTPAQRQME